MNKSYVSTINLLMISLSQSDIYNYLFMKYMASDYDYFLKNLTPNCTRTSHVDEEMRLREISALYNLDNFMNKRAYIGLTFYVIFLHNFPQI